MQNLPFDKPGRFFKGNLHTHSTRSDGGLSPGEVVAAYRARGYDFLSLTDHFLEKYDFPIVDTTAYREDQFTTILGAELHGPTLENGDPWHILAVGLPLDFPPPAPDETGPAIASRAAAAGAFVGIAHPAWYSLSLDDALTLADAHAVEIYNTGCDREIDRGDSWHLTDVLLGRGKRLFAYATDDAHFGERPDAFGGWVQVRAERLDPGDILAALKAGHFYSSQGPELRDIRATGGELHVACSPAAAIHLTGRGSLRRSQHGDALEGAILPLAPFRGGPCRVTVIDSAGKRAWSNPIWLD
ncbi:MAG: Phosphoesterase PHP, N-terminal precursor [uncultured Thermomicrobiales bacterium]|uniref:Phosphoesterase PHP, N-terminal n=2 Tax=Bacteria TaxID=2 RepID=A0A6J4V5X0_9BACT|nr:MAG: Phosphoesterase PHP, N-terminal precursor [uncultured Thermomicrobiales bacterium]